MVDRYFYKLIKPLSYEEGLEVEKSGFAWQNEMFICNSCLRLRRREKYVEVNTIHNLIGQREMYETNRSLTLPVPYCIDCGFEQELPRCRLGDVFSKKYGYSRMSQVFCNGCEEFAELSQRKKFSMCKTCWQKCSCNWREKFVDTDFRHCHHSHLCETCFEPFTDCHWVQRLISRYVSNLAKVLYLVV